ncbi:MAG: Leucyl-tRNA synthetase [uncultured Gemmatimonadetes bacterium]|uniref:Leucine--tRNA ligase n=1 Tax=uncultured Gemmatimonadota bacterium TaxID=203437 RepID=A0A6J4MQP5_9BACT|nr:MAG: Leucyl-tRNA synthetase [uncultured Gemmatimonadota bacterium]
MSDGNHTDSYNPAEVERKWQARWDERGTNAWTDEALRSAEKPFYNLMMFPYPSAEGLHVGNIYAFAGADIYGRFKRLQGYQVFEPIGFDAFGIHSENFALKQGIHPTELIPRNVERFTRQLRRVGLMYDWNHTVDTTTPDYYRWTQWIFLQLYKAGLAEKKAAPVNWCPSCNTVLANEQVEGGECERCGTAVEMRFLSQWFFKITNYAGKLLDNLKTLDWSDTTRKAQENWIGRSEGAELAFPIARRRLADDRHEGAQVEVERPVIRVFTTRPDTVFGATYMVLAPEHPLVERVTTPEQRDAVDAYRRQASAQDLVTRKKTDKTKTGVWTGGHAVNPATKQEIPVWIADYVLMEYGTGAIMAVPGHDERDFEFATGFGLPIVRVVAGEGDDGDSPLTEAYTGPGRLVNSGQFEGTDVGEAKSAVAEWLASMGVGEKRINYRLHDWTISRQRYWGPPIPILYCDTCGIVPVPEDQLPVLLPFIDDFKPDASGISPLARHEEWYRTECPSCGGQARRETDVSDTFLDSAWYFLRYPSAGNEAVPFDPGITRTWLPVHSYIGGNEHAVLHLLYSRFVTMALKDMGHIDFEEPFTRFRAHGLIIKDGTKMSKTRGNVVVPDNYIAEWGADTFRTYLMFLGPYQEGGDFRDSGITGPYNFLTRLWDSALTAEDREMDRDVEQKLHATIKKVTEDLEALSYNTAVAAMMEYLNVVRAGGRTPERAAVEPMVRLVAPFAPHMAEELWERMGGEGSIFDAASWPEFDPARAVADTVEFVVQVNGKVRARMPMARGIAEALARDAALADENVRRWIEDKQVRKTIFVPDRLVNLVVG